MKQRTTADVLTFLHVSRAVLQRVHEEHEILAGVMADVVVDQARGLVITPGRGENAWAARLARIEEVMRPFEDAVVHMLGEARLPGEEALAYFIRISDMCQPDFPTAMRERGFEPPDEDAQ